MQRFITPLALLLFLILPAGVQAASIFVGSGVSAGEGNAILIPVVLDTGNEPVNAVSGEVLVPKTLRVTGINSASSVITFWVHEPKVSAGIEKSNQVSYEFSGVIAGGISTRTGILFSLVAVPVEEGAHSSYLLGINNAAAFKNDGLGTQLTIAAQNTTISAPNGPSQVAGIQIAQTDTTPPELFTPALGHNSHVFDDKWFVAFTARDPGSGISHYEVQETRANTPDPNNWVRTSSPYVLKDQTHTVSIFVRAIDNAGNVATALIVHRAGGSLGASLWYIFAGILIGGTLLFILWRWSRHPLGRSTV